jgi:hypothetical protein
MEKKYDIVREEIVRDYIKREEAEVKRDKTSRDFVGFRHG